MENKSHQGGVIDNGNTPGESPFIQLAQKGPPSDSVGTGSERPYAVKGRGYEGPGVGSAKRLNSDDQMPCSPGSCT